MSTRGHKHKWVMVWNNHYAGGPWKNWSRAVYQCAVKRCKEVGYSC